MTEVGRLQCKGAWMLALLLLILLPAGELAFAQLQGPAPEVRTGPATTSSTESDPQATQVKARAELLEKIDEALANLDCLRAHPAELKEESLQVIEGATTKLENLRLSLTKAPRTLSSCSGKYLDDARAALADAEPSASILAAGEQSQLEATTRLLSSVSLSSLPTPSRGPSNLQLASWALSAFTLLLLGWHVLSQGQTKGSTDVAELKVQVAELERVAAVAIGNYNAVQQVHSELKERAEPRYAEAPAVALTPEPRTAVVPARAELQTAGRAAQAATGEPESIGLSNSSATITASREDAATLGSVGQDEPSGDPVTDYNRARELGGPEAEAAFKAAYAPCISVACTNLAQRVMPGIQFTFKPASRTSFLVATSPDGKAFLLPQFGTEYPFGRALMEGPFVYPSGETQELHLAKAGMLEAVGEEWVLFERGVFSA